ncbi:pantoate--beta-alanine ligase [Rhizorhapis suberifaciens]|uniref:Pantothenate synthetase n=1 Tax=Rhizorhapis suberifaciens TaxID=13656 RepID=A0A840HYI3_9SPHN|nr:pantoate--beta-alanine ligase [Rhizorhapis suberifaciens]MBB4642434.1 pantoate--beta-alanine ligase [Rhizorhapis suberifaciens]
MQIIRELALLREAVGILRNGGRKRIALVPTMGALHDGHLALIDEARTHADHVIASIFVNPKQFGANEDLDSYPRREATDAKLLTDRGCDVLWCPTVDEVYPDGFATTISVSGISEGLCGGARPGHFDGVATVVAKLFNQVQPDVAIFGEKDYQQLAVIRRMARDLDFNIDIIGVPTQRDTDGLALSSRNTYLTDEERKAAHALPRALGQAAARIEKGGDVAEALDKAKAALAAAGFDPIDYVELRDAVTLKPVSNAKQPARLLAAAKIGQTRLIDNIEVKRK